jgi:NAD(P)-dependent dehydrogenase (short-subunit alcohol dehydrogenase family)
MPVRQPADTRRHPKPPFPARRLPKPGLEAKLRPKPQWQAPDYKAAGKLEGKVALVTGGDSGIGRAVAVLFAREGADVAINFLSTEAVDAHVTAAAVRACGRRCLLVPGDLGRDRVCDRIVERTVRTLGKLDILVSNAAHQNHNDDLADVQDAEFDRTFKVNVYAYFRLARAALRHMEPGGAIIATSSVTGLLGSPELPDYSATKGAINAFTRTLAQNLVERGIRVNAVAPGPVWTPLNAADKGRSPKEIATFGADVPMKRPAQPEEIAPAYVFLASNADSSYITGSVLQILGGRTAGA